MTDEIYMPYGIPDTPFYRKMIMKDNMIDRVAQAIFAKDPESLFTIHQARVYAIAAIAAMREPNESMRRKLWLYGNHPDKEFIMDGGMWREMIDDALGDE